MDAFHERLIVRAATIDELLSDDFEPAPGDKGDPDLAERRLAAWCRSCAGGDRQLFNRRLERDGLAYSDVLTRFAAARRKASAPVPAWLDDAIWIEKALQGPADARADQLEPCAFEHLFTPVIKQAEEILLASVDPRIFDNLGQSARAELRHSLLKELCSLSAPSVYERFAKARQHGRQGEATSIYSQFVADMKAGGFRQLFEEKPVLLRLISVITRQWIETSREFVLRLDTDLPMIRRELLNGRGNSLVAKIEGDISDPHNGGRSVRIVTFTDGTRILYKPKDLRVDLAWQKLIDRLNGAKSSVELQAARTITADGYGWAEFIDHAGCSDQQGYKGFFKRAGAWLALFHCFVTNDMHQENMIATGDQPVPIDLETILQSSDQRHGPPVPEAQAFDAAVEMLANSVMMVGLLPAYGRSPENKIFAIGGMTADWSAKIKIRWDNINSDEMRPTRSKETNTANPNLPHINGRYASFREHVSDFISGFEDYAGFLAGQGKGTKPGIFDGFAGISVRKVLRATRFYSMLLLRLKNHRDMDDGVMWSAQADFVARLADWDKDIDPFWPVHRAERSALLALNVPHFVTRTDGKDICDASGFSLATDGETGLERARKRVAALDASEIAWQVEVIRQNTASVTKRAVAGTAGNRSGRDVPSDVSVSPTKETFVAAAGKIAEELSQLAIRKGPGAAWIGLDWLGDADVFQLVSLGPDLYNGVSGIALFLAAHAAVSGSDSSAELAHAALAYLRKNLKSRNAARMGRALGLGGATGLGSIVYVLSLTSKYLHDNILLEDAHVAARLFTDDLIAADKQLDVIGGSAGGALGLLRLYRDSQSKDVLTRAIKCGEHLIAQNRLGPEGRRSWVGQGLGEHALNGMSHGAAGFAFALAALSSASGREDFAQAAAECIAFENSSYDSERKNWPDLRGAQPSWPCQWCHGAPGIGLARVATAKRGGIAAKTLEPDIQHAVEAATRAWPGGLDTLCCGTLGSVELFCEAGNALERDELRDLASRRLLAVLETAASNGDYRWNSGKRRFNLGLFRGIAGVGYTALRRVDGSLSNVLIWE
ncbi:MAG TPA: type 2 lanthipeptide synthetase LanM family protein [Pseudolabrys sp.]|nr:type 2 lanthipeptide synthetase LanM family protein [Pseudolabrys sp.]